MEWKHKNKYILYLNKSTSLTIISGNNLLITLIHAFPVFDKIFYMKIYSFLLVFFIILHGLKAQSTMEIYVKDVSGPVISLTGDWKICLKPQRNFWEGNSPDCDWQNIQVPGEVMMQGYPIKHDKPFIYRKTFRIPEDYKGKITKLRFEGVYSYTRVWINGTFIRDHHGRFTA